MNRAIFAFVLMCAFASAASAAALRDQLGEAKAAAVEAAFRTAVPTARLTWGETLSVTMPDEAKSEVRIVGPDPFGAMWVLHVELTDFAKAAMAHAKSFSKEPAPTHPTDFIAAVDGSGNARVARLDPTGFGIEVKRFDVAQEYEVPQTWPAVTVTYWAHYATTDWVGSVRWSGIYNLETRGDIARMPMGVAKRTAAGGGASEQVAATRATEEIVEIEGGQTGRIIQYPCRIPCTFDGKSILAAWAVDAAPAPVVAD